MSQGHATPQTLCVVSDAGLRRRLRRSLLGTGTHVEFCDSLSAATKAAQQPRLLFLDKESRRDESLPHLLQVMDAEGKVVIIGESIADNDFVALMRQQPFDNVVDENTEESELVVTSVKLLTGDIFGLDKYLSWGSDLHTMEVHDYDSKRVGVEGVARFASALGARRKILAQIENVCDELLMNAIYDAPAAFESHREVAHDLTLGPVPVTEHVKTRPAILSYGCDGRFFGISVVDHYGELEKQSILENLLRARESGGRPREGTAGAGLGIYFVLSSVSRYVANIQQGVKTEVICLFDMRRTGREAPSCTESLNIFTTDSRKRD